MRHKSILAAATLSVAVISPATAALVRTFTMSVGTQPSNVGTITLTQSGANAVVVSLDLLSNTYGIINTGGPHTPFAFNLSVSSVGLSISPFSTPAGGTYAHGTFTLDTGGGDNTPYGSYGVAIASSAGNGSSNGYFGDLLFTLNRTGGLSVDDFVANSDGYVFSADLSDGTNTGAQAWAAPVPVPATLPLFLSAITGLGLVVRRKKQAA